MPLLGRNVKIELSTEKTTKPSERNRQWTVEFLFNIDAGHEFQDLPPSTQKRFTFFGKPVLLVDSDIHPNRKNSGYRDIVFTITSLNSESECFEVINRFLYQIIRFANRNFIGLAQSNKIIHESMPKRQSASTFANFVNPVNFQDFLDSINKINPNKIHVDDELILSMELLAFSSYGASNQSRLLLQMSSIEALANQSDLSNKLSPLIEDLISVVDSHDEIEESIRKSIVGQIKGMRRQSVRQAIKGLCEKCHLSEEDIKFVDSVAYSARSKLLHEGITPKDIGNICGRLHMIILSIHEKFHRTIDLNQKK
ncbi:MAG: hypothetical protein R3175_04385 [Marinobacter sp.]|uniref:hypothetical protein n=1 Tax=Marinobacter sp. TaxID=50741 RepID=UPI00299DCCC4|nr:hypothetical protein [Marinobacter sp.]MDX1755278.1 hypothetical protein [Marinobacter sp.]